MKRFIDSLGNITIQFNNKEYPMSNHNLDVSAFKADTNWKTSVTLIRDEYYKYAPGKAEF